VVNGIILFVGAFIVVFAVAYFRVYKPKRDARKKAASESEPNNDGDK